MVATGHHHSRFLTPQSCMSPAVVCAFRGPAAESQGLPAAVYPSVTQQSYGGGTMQRRVDRAQIRAGTERGDASGIEIRGSE